MRRLLLLVPLGLVALVVVASALDARASDGEALRGVTIAGIDVAGLDEERLREVTATVAHRYDERDITISTPDGDIVTSSASIGLEVDVDASVARALDEGRDDALPVRPIRWLQSLLRGREAGVVATVDDAKLRAVVASQDPTDRTEPVEPGIAGDEGQIGIVIGEHGEGLDAVSIGESIVAAAGRGELPIEIDAEPGRIAPRFSREDAEALAAEASELTDSPIEVRAGETEASIPGSVVRSWLRSTPGDEELELALDEESVLDDLAELLAEAGTQPQDARITVEGGRPVIVRGVEGTACCAPESVGFLLGAVKAGHGGPVRLPLETTPPDVTTADLEALGIVEEIGAFTTRFEAGQSRVTNIHRIADLTRGVVLEPGESFSVNEHVGKRTTENGFVVGGVIENGTFSESVGGGISQFATTLFNAAFFGGLDIEEYQSHSIYISRYPYGREATLSYPKPDLVIENSTPHGVLIWTSHTPTSVTVSLYSTRYARGEQTAQSEAPVGEAGCKRVTTERTRTYVDGSTKVDKVYAVYRPSEGVQC